MLTKICKLVRKWKIIYTMSRNPKSIKDGDDSMGIFKAKELACYISKIYYKNYTRNISPIKMQKSLYFLFAYWGGFISRAKNSKASVEFDFSSYDEILFEEKIEAWAYGPVVPDVYFDSNICSNDIEHMFDSKEYVKEFIDGLLDELFVLSDFKLVEISHSDNAWKNNFDINSEFHNAEILKTDIINEYASREHF